MSDIFIKREAQAQPGFNIAVLLSRKETKGDIGLEIEVEGNKFPKPSGYEGTHHPVRMYNDDGTYDKYWSYVHDGSLRGTDNAEYVLTSPVNFDKVPEAVYSIFDRMKAYGSKLDESNRTSVHVHLNCQEFHLNRLTSLMALYFIFEEVLTEWCGDHRVGNLFCLRAKDAPAIVSQIRRFIRTDGQSQLQDHLHYSGMNANALFKLGSLEWRTLRGCTDPKPILDWVHILERLYKLSADFEDPRDICALFSAEGPLAFFENILGDSASVVLDGISFDTDRIGESMYEGIRLAQDLCYCRDWTLYKAMKLKKDPFGRDPRKMLNKLTGLSQGMQTFSPQTLSFDAPVPSWTVEDEFAEEPEPDYDDDPEEDDF